MEKNKLTLLTPEAVLTACHGFGFAPTLTQAAGIAKYLGLLEQWNRHMNLVGQAGWLDILGQLVIDSLYLAAFLNTLPLPKAPGVLDLGAGAGLPGIPLRLFWECGRYILVERREKRIVFLRYVLGTLQLPRTELFAGSVDAALTQEAPPNLVISRAFRPWPEVLRLLIDKLAPGGLVLSMMLDPAPDSASIPSGWHLLASRSYSVAGTARCFWVFSTVPP